MNALNPAIFKAYDVRGTYPDQINDDTARLLGQAIATYLNVSQIAVGRDMRVSSPNLAAALIDGITAQGVDVVDLGEVSSDELYFAVGKFGYPAGAMVSASHNPKQYNGIKLCRAEAVPISSTTGLADIRDRALAGNFPSASQRGSVTMHDVLDAYAEHVLSFVDVSAIKPMTIAIDAGNGMAGKTLPAVFKHLPCTVIPLYYELDGTFPHHPASPIEPENMLDVQAEVRKSGAAMGAAFDGDADRMFITDEHGELVDASMVTAMVTQSLLGRFPGSTILYNLICSHSIPELVQAMGGRAIRTRVGHSFIKAQMREENAIFGGEHSGHFYFRDFWFADSGLIALLTVLEVVSRANTSVSKVVASLSQRSRSGEINSTVADIPTQMSALEQHYSDGSIDYLDGLTVAYADWWFNVRASNTEPLLRLNVEADTRALMELKRDEMLALIRA